MEGVLDFGPLNLFLGPTSRQQTDVPSLATNAADMSAVLQTPGGRNDAGGGTGSRSRDGVEEAARNCGVEIESAWTRYHSLVAGNPILLFPIHYAHAHYVREEFTCVTHGENSDLYRKAERFQGLKAGISSILPHFNCTLMSKTGHGIVPYYATGRRVFSGIYHFPRPIIPALLHIHINLSHRLSRNRGLKQPKSLRSLLTHAYKWKQTCSLPDARAAENTVGRFNASSSAPWQPRSTLKIAPLYRRREREAALGTWRPVLFSFSYCSKLTLNCCDNEWVVSEDGTQRLYILLWSPSTRGARLHVQRGLGRQPVKLWNHFGEGGEGIQSRSGQISYKDRTMAARGHLAPVCRGPFLHVACRRTPVSGRGSSPPSAAVERDSTQPSLIPQ
ncbi:hypothetical protein PR048_016641 [Dryococelus australis]|uniref:Uncharacterized protein n=1 Tax=Dryococelus australis TaxID=614101 RepID=A0ABQ9H798_9NEOP|nr:hypothetical protein PR048_016641 [Dryococelus australis]